MLTIIGNGMGEYDFSNIIYDLNSFDIIVCDKNFIVDGDNILKLSFKDAKDYILSNYKEKNIAYIVTGSPLFYSGGILLAKKLPKNMVKIVDNRSSKQYIQEKLFISDTSIESISLHGRDSIDLTKFLVNTYTFILCDKNSIDILQNSMKFLSKDDIEVTIGYKLGYSDEAIKTIDIFDSSSYEEFDLTMPYILLIKKLFSKIPSKDSDFVTQRGMITKEYKRNLSLQNLNLQPNQLLWDIGAGSGSCGIEAFKRYRVKTVFFEKQSQRVENIKINLSNHKVVDTILLEGEAQQLWLSLENNPDRIFVGGGGEEVIKQLPYLYDRLNLDGIILINAITLKHLNLILNSLENHNIEYEIFSLGITTYKGGLNLVEPQRQLFQIRILK